MQGFSRSRDAWIISPAPAIIDLPAEGRFVMVRAADRSRKEEHD
jgi:hypothetical protein